MQENASVWVTPGPMVQIQGNLPSNAPALLRRAGAFDKDDSWWCTAVQWPRVERTLKALGVVVGMDGPVAAAPQVRQATMNLSSIGELQAVGDLPRVIKKPWLAKLRADRLAGISPWAYHDFYDTCMSEGIKVRIESDARDLANLVEERMTETDVARVRRDLPEIPLEDGELMEFQQRAIAFGLAAGGRFLIGDQPGLGKTVQAIAFKRAIDAQRVVVLCPSVVRGNWRDEIKRFDGQDALVLSGYPDGRQTFHGTQWLVCNYDVLADKEGKHSTQQGWVDALMAWQPDLVIFDESHYLKGHKSARSMAARRLSRKTPHCILMSGTPMGNGPMDLWSQLDILQPGWWGGWFDFGMAFCAGHRGRWGGFDFSGSSNTETLHQRLQYVMIRRLTKDVLTELPSQTRTQYRVALNDLARKEYNAILKEYREHVKKAKQEGEELNKERRLRFVMQLRQASSRGRAKETCDLVADMVEEGKRPVVFAYFRESIDNLVHGLKEHKLKVAVIDGRVTNWEVRRQIQADFNAGKYDVLVGQSEAAGVGINLHEGSDMTITHELTYRPIDIEQTEGRIYRKGQKNPVQHIYMIGEDTRDETMLSLLLKKVAQSTGVLDTGESIEDDLLREIEASFFQDGI